jgi:threonylcarbamoyladenosine tRNA methylthiotransferase MtaB
VRVYLRTFGCRANHYDSEAVRAMLESAGHEVVASAADADAAVFNSCAVTSEAEAELRKVVRHVARERPALRSVVMGCAAALDDAREPAKRIRGLPTVESVVAGADLPSVAAALGLPPSVLRVAAARQSSTRALLRVQDGCDEHCTFCATTLARGANRSRSADELIAEAQTLADSHAEIVITGIHIGSYGADVGSSLGELVERLVREVPRARFRLSSIEATEIDERLAELLTHSDGRLVPHVHAPLQSGSDRLLRRMGRHWYTSASYATSIERLATNMSVLGLGADIITGFPGETDSDHAQTVALVERLPFTYLHVFPYSPRPGTAAQRLPNPVQPAVARARAAELRALAERKAAAYSASRVGGRADVIVVRGGERREGLTGDYLTVLPTDATLPRGARFTAQLAQENLRLVARPITPGVIPSKARDLHLPLSEIVR